MKKNNSGINKKRRKIKSNIREEKNLRRFLIKNSNGIRDNIDKIVDQAEDELSKLDVLEEIYSYQDDFIKVDPALIGALDIVLRNSQRDINHMNSIVSNWGKIKLHTDSFNTAFTASGSLVPSMVSGSTIIAERLGKRSHRYIYTEKLNDPSPQDRRKLLVKQLGKIDPNLLNRLNGAWQTLQDRSKEDRFSQSSASVRELVTGLLNKLAPHNCVMTSWWYIQSPDTRKATRKQRIQYLIMGHNKQIKGTEFETIIEVVDDLYQEFDKLSKITHIQEQMQSLEDMTRGIIDQCQIHLLKVLELRKQYFMD